MLRRCHPVHLEEVIHEGQGANADALRPLGERGDAGPDARRTAGPVESRDVEVKLHTRRSSAPTPGATAAASAARVRHHRGVDDGRGAYFISSPDGLHPVPEARSPWAA